MDNGMIATHLENIDRRLAKVEQILPTLATKDEIGLLATKQEMRGLATKAELAVAIAPLATKAELAAAIAPLATKEQIVELRRHMDVVGESLRSDIQLLAEHLAARLKPLR